MSDQVIIDKEAALNSIEDARKSGDLAAMEKVIRAFPPGSRITVGTTGKEDNVEIYVDGYTRVGDDEAEYLHLHCAIILTDIAVYTSASFSMDDCFMMVPSLTAEEVDRALKGAMN